MEVWALWIIGISIVACIIMLIWETADMMTAKAWEKWRIRCERKEVEEKQLVEKIRYIAHKEIIDRELAIELIVRTMKGHE